MKISPGAAVLCAARIGKSAFMNMRKDQILSFIQMIEKNSSLFSSPSLENIFQNDDFQRLNANFPSSGLNGPQPLIPTAHVAANRNDDTIHVQNSQDLGVSGSKTPAKVQGCPDSMFLLYVGTPAVQDIGKSDLLGIPVNLSDIEVFNGEPAAVFKREEISGMQRDLGKAFIRRLGGEPVIHQTIASMLFARTKDQVEAEFKQWDWLISQIRNKSLLKYVRDKEVSNVLILLSNTNSDWEEISIPDLYGHLRMLSAFHGSLAVFPSETETQWASWKIGDLQILDKIAQDADWEYSYRPRTCSGMGKCALPSKTVKKMVTKRSQSCGAGHVKIVDGTERDNLRCIDTEESNSKLCETDIDIRQPIFFHQEYIDSLRTFGEYRIFICRGRIIGIAFTKFKEDGKPNNFAVERATSKHLAWFSAEHEKQQQKLEELRGFALFQYSRLLDLSDVREEYRSLRVGIRLDIGVSELSSEGRFFVSEPTRIYAADFMSQLILDQPYTAIAKEWGEAVRDEYIGYFEGIK
ncbi:uncharacterized protein FTOL_08628 [Fusarium torulosum]|uniref:Uncharacterized protein n=1 Tax=Fusarium torulosum TaxID=33205 RepID=A0AAE8MFK2_9HYPO|nr:uncharacterized protein FTOL_08628 [Fusarium torulosum]